MSPDTDFDPTSLDGWEETAVCGEALTVTVGGVEHELHCEDEPDHEPPHSGTLLWTAQQ